MSAKKKKKTRALHGFIVQKYICDMYKYVCICSAIGSKKKKTAEEQQQKKKRKVISAQPLKKKKGSLRLEKNNLLSN